MDNGKAPLKKQKEVRVYQSEDLLVFWDANKCIHSAECWTGLPKVFNPWDRPWVKIQEAKPEQIINVINNCPSGALKYKLTEHSKVSPDLARGMGAVK